MARRGQLINSPCANLVLIVERGASKMLRVFLLVLGIVSFSALGEDPLLKGCGNVEGALFLRISDLPEDAQTNEMKIESRSAKIALNAYREAKRLADLQKWEGAQGAAAVLVDLPFHVPSLDCFRANLLYLSGSEKAKDAYIQVLENDDGNAHALVRLGSIEEKGKGNPVDSLHFFERALSIMPTSTAALLGRARALYQAAHPRNKDSVKRALEAWQDIQDRSLDIDESSMSAHMRLGDLYSMLENHKKSIEHYEIAAKANPSVPVIHTRLGNELETQGKILEEYGRKGDTSASQRMIESAIAHFQQATWLNTSDTNAKERLARLYSHRKRHGDAAREYEQCVEIRPQSLDFHILVARAHFDDGNFKSAVDWFKRALMQLSENAPPAQISKLLLGLGQAMLRAGKPLHATKQLHLALQHDKDNVETMLLLGDALMQTGQYSSAWKHFDAVLSRGAARSISKAIVAAAYFQRAACSDAMTEIEKAESRRNKFSVIEDFVLAFEMGAKEGYGTFLDASTLLGGRQRLARLLHEEGNPKAAISVLAKGVKEFPNAALAYFNLGCYVSEGGAIAEALPFFQKSVWLNSSCAVCHYAVGDAFMTLGKTHRAADSFRSVIALNESHTNAHIGIGDVLMSLRQYDSAIGSYKRALSVSRSLGKAPTALLSKLQNNLAVAHFHKNDIPGAISWFRLTVQTDPSNAIAHANLAKLLSGSGQPKEAMKHKKISEVLFQTEKEPIYATGTTSGRRTSSSSQHAKKANRMNSVQSSSWSWSSFVMGALRMFSEFISPSKINNTQNATSSKAQKVLDLNVPVSGMLSLQFADSGKQGTGASKGMWSLGDAPNDGKIAKSMLCPPLDDSNRDDASAIASYLSLGEVLATSGDVMEARKCFNAVVLSGHSASKSFAQFYIAKSYLLEEPGTISEDVRAMVLESARHAQPTQQHFEESLLVASRLSASPEDSAKLLRRGVSALPNSMQLAYSLAQQLLLMGDFREAAKVLMPHCTERAFRKPGAIVTPAHAFTHMLCGKALRGSNALMEAANQFQLAYDVISKLSPDGVYDEMELPSLVPPPEILSYAAISVFYLAEKASLMLDLRRTQEAADLYVDAVKLTSEDAPLGTVPQRVAEDAFLGLASLLKSDEQYYMAAHVYRASLLQFEESVRIRSALAVLWEEREFFIEAAVEHKIIILLNKTKESFESSSASLNRLLHAHKESAVTATSDRVREMDDIGSLIASVGGGPMCAGDGMCEDLLSALNTGTVIFSAVQYTTSATQQIRKDFLERMGCKRAHVYERISGYFAGREAWGAALYFSREWVLEEPLSAKAHFSTGRALDQMLIAANADHSTLEKFSVWVSFVTHHMEMAVSLATRSAPDASALSMVSKALCTAGRIALLKREYAHAETYFEKALDISPDYANFEANLGLARVLANNGGTVMAFSRLSEAAKLRKSSSALTGSLNGLEKASFSRAFTQLGEVFSDQAAFNEAIEAFQEAIAMSPGDWSIYFKAGKAAVLSSRFGDGKVFMSKALEINPSEPRIYNGAGAAAYNLDEHREAAEYFSQCLKLLIARKSSLEEIALARLNLGLAFESMGSREKAALHLRETIRMNPPFDLLMNVQEQLARMLSTMGKSSAAIAILKEVIKARQLRAQQAQAKDKMDTVVKVAVDGAVIEHASKYSEVHQSLVLYAHVLRGAGKMKESERIIDRLMASGVPSKELAVLSQKCSGKVILM